MKLTIIIEHKLDKTLFGYINNTYFDRWFNENDMQSFCYSIRRLADTLGYELQILHTWEKENER